MSGFSNAIPKRIVHALEALVHIALHHNIQPVNGKLLSEAQNLPPRYLERMLQCCVHYGILRSIRGPRGGYVLAKERRRITVGEISRVLWLSEDEVCTDIAQESELLQQVIQPVCQEAESALMRALDKVTLSDLCDQAVQKGLFATMPIPTHKSHMDEALFSI